MAGILVFINCWKGAGYSSVIYLAAILGIDQEMFEAASIDGASGMEEDSLHYNSMS